MGNKLRELIAKWRGLRTSSDAFLSASAYGTYEMAADELAALLDNQPAPAPALTGSGSVDEAAITNTCYRIWNDLVEFLSFIGPHDNKYKAIAAIQGEIVRMLNDEGVNSQASGSIVRGPEEGEKRVLCVICGKREELHGPSNHCPTDEEFSPVFTPSSSGRKS